MTTSMLLLIAGFYLLLIFPVAYFTRATVRRLLAALVGGVVFGLVGIVAIALGETRGLWRLPRGGSSYFELLLWLGFAVSCVPTYLVLWRVVRRFGNRGLALCVLAAALIGPPRDYMLVRMFPAWMTFAPGLAPILADAAVYALLIFIGHAVMRRVAGPAQADALARSYLQ